MHRLDATDLAHAQGPPARRRLVECAWRLGGEHDLATAAAAALGTRARVPRTLLHQEPPLLHDVHRAAPGRHEHVHAAPTTANHASHGDARSRRRHRRTARWALQRLRTTGAGDAWLAETGAKRALEKRRIAREELSRPAASRQRTQSQSEVRRSMGMQSDAGGEQYVTAREVAERWDCRRTRSCATTATGRSPAVGCRGRSARCGSCGARSRRRSTGSPTGGRRRARSGPTGRRPGSVSAQRGQIFRRPNGLWAIRYRDAHGRRPQRTGFRTAVEARIALEEELRRVRLGPLYRPNVTLRELNDAYLEQYDAAPSTVVFLQGQHEARARRPSVTSRSASCAVDGSRRGGRAARGQAVPVAARAAPGARGRRALEVDRGQPGGAGEEP